MTTKDLRSETARQARDLLNSVTAELDAAELSRRPGDDTARYALRGAPLQMTLHFARDDEARSQEMNATTLGGARDIVTAAWNLIRAESLQLHPGDLVAQTGSLDRPLVVSVRYDLDDLDRTDLLDSSLPPQDPHVETAPALATASDGPTVEEPGHTTGESPQRGVLSRFLTGRS
ncbi:hypothetical protein ACFYMW_25610 [Streptomyces sp. NPDC006692]|uniref:hypothetical protein n=1 Tax=unclassified Streptomyces TaxID=2593676 RepID=UPI003423A7C8